MNKLMSFLAVGLLVPACAGSGGEGDDATGGGGGKADDTTTSATRTIDAQWKLQDIATGQVAACPQGYDTVALMAQKLDPDGDPVGAPIVDLFDCAAGDGTTAPLPAARYQIWLDIASHDGTNVYAQSTSTIVDLTAYNKSVSFSILRDGGYFSLAWDLVGGDTGDTLACDDVAGLDGIELVATLSSSSESTVDIWDCEDGYGVTACYKAGTYTVSVDALAASGGALGVAPAFTGTIQTRNRVTSLGQVEIPIDGM